MILRVLFVLGLLAGSFHTLFAQGPQTLEADAVAYRYDSGHAEVDLQYGVLQRALAFEQKGKVWTAVTSCTVEVWQNGTAIQSKAIHDTVRFPGTKAQLDSAGASELLGAMGFAVPYGVPTRMAFIWQKGDKVGKGGFDTIVIPVALPDRDSTKFSFSGIELASNIAKSGVTLGPFDRNGVTVTPNPSNIFGENYTTLYYYTELYVPAAYVKPNEQADITTEVVDGTGTVTMSNTQKVALSGPIVPVALGLDIDGLSSDSYRLRIRAKVEDAVQAEAEKIFFNTSDMKLSEDAPPPPSSFSNDSILFAESDFVRMSDAEADVAVAQSMYWADETDQKLAKKLNSVSDKQRFLFSFWRNQDTKHNSAQPLDAYRLFKRRVDQANSQFSYQKTPGWKTGRGRILITYGPPKRITNVLFDPSYKPYIIWQYDPTPDIRLTTGTFAEFDFVDRMGGGNFYVVSSNASGETYDSNWMTDEAYKLMSPNGLQH